MDARPLLTINTHVTYTGHDIIMINRLRVRSRSSINDDGGGGGDADACYNVINISYYLPAASSDQLRSGLRGRERINVPVRDARPRLKGCICYFDRCCCCCCRPLRTIYAFRLSRRVKRSQSKGPLGRPRRRQRLTADRQRANALQSQRRGGASGMSRSARLIHLGRHKHGPVRRTVPTRALYAR